MKCANCETTGHRKLYEDPSSPPIDTGDCLCKECRGNFLFDEIEEAQRQVDDLKDLYTGEGHSGR